MVIKIFNERVPPEVRRMESAQRIKTLLSHGVGVHHAGILPQLKEAVEVLFNEGLVRVLYATETFAVGINMPAKCVCFNSLEKYDGKGFRLLNSKEYFQMAGRAGRRGIDKVGYSIILADRSRLNLTKVIPTISQDKDPIVSQFQICYNTILNLKAHYKNEEKIETILKSNFGYFVQKMSKKQMRIMTTYKNMVRNLQKLGYLEGDYLTEKGEFATYIYANELALTEFMYSGAFDQLKEDDVCVVIAAIIFEGKTRKYPTKAKVDYLLHVIDRNKILRDSVKITYLKAVHRIVKSWANGCTFEELLAMAEMDEGDFIRMFRQILDVLKQLRKAAEMDAPAAEKLSRCMDLLDRDLVKVQL